MTLFGWKIKRVPVTIIAILLLLGTTATAPVNVKGYTWGPWTTKYVPATTAECNLSRHLAWLWGAPISQGGYGRYGPLEYYGRGCVERIRIRRMYIDNTPWVDKVLEIENTSALWPAWGMNLTVRVHWNGKIAKYDESSLWCKNWSFIIKVTPIQCKVWDSGTSSMLVRMAYDASFIQEGFAFGAQRGAEVFVFGSGIGSVRSWP